METKVRYSLIDAIRAVAVVNMVAFHLCYNIFAVFGVWTDFPVSTPVVIWERFICCTVIIVSGVSLNFSKHGYRRGLIVSLCGIVVTLVTIRFMPEQTILYGVLTFLGAAMLLTFALRKALSRIPPIVGMIVFFLHAVLRDPLRVSRAVQIAADPAPRGAVSIPVARVLRFCAEGFFLRRLLPVFAVDLPVSLRVHAVAADQAEGA